MANLALIIQITLRLILLTEAQAQNKCMDGHRKKREGVFWNELCFLGGQEGSSESWAHPSESWPHPAELTASPSQESATVL